MAAHAGGLDEFWQSDQASASSRSQASTSGRWVIFGPLICSITVRTA
jgi:hypothetical protein